MILLFIIILFFFVVTSTITTITITIVTVTSSSPSSASSPSALLSSSSTTTSWIIVVVIGGTWMSLGSRLFHREVSTTGIDLKPRLAGEAHGVCKHKDVTGQDMTTQSPPEMEAKPNHSSGLWFKIPPSLPGLPAQTLNRTVSPNCMWFLCSPRPPAEPATEEPPGAFSAVVKAVGVVNGSCT